MPGFKSSITTSQLYDPQWVTGSLCFHTCEKTGDHSHLAYRIVVGLNGSIHIKCLEYIFSWSSVFLACIYIFFFFFFCLFTNSGNKNSIISTYFLPFRGRVGEGNGFFQRLRIRVQFFYFNLYNIYLMVLFIHINYKHFLSYVENSTFFFNTRFPFLWEDIQRHQQFLANVWILFLSFFEVLNREHMIFKNSSWNRSYFLIPSMCIVYVFQINMDGDCFWILEAK